MVRARHRLALVAACLGVSAVAGCAVASPGQPAGGTAGRSASAPAAPVAPAPASAPASAVASPPAARPASPPTSPNPSASLSLTGVNVAAFNALARQEASAWPNSALGKVWKTGLVIPVADDLSSGPSGGFPSVETKIAFGNGNLVYTGSPPKGAPAGVVTWADGSSMKVPVLSEAQVFSALKNNTAGRCPSCATTPLAVTAAQPTTMPVATSRTPTSLCITLRVGMMNQFMKNPFRKPQPSAIRQSPTAYCSHEHGIEIASPTSGSQTCQRVSRWVSRSVIRPPVIRLAALANPPERPNARPMVP